MNRGLKSYTKQLTQTVGNAGSVNINLNNDDANLIMTLPLLSTTGVEPIDLSLIYNHQDKEEDTGFGGGFKLNFYRKLESNGNVKNADGSVDTYQLNVKNEETQCTLKYSNGSNLSGGLDFLDKYGNISHYTGYGNSYPAYIEMIDGTKYSISTNDGKITSITNHKGSLLSFDLENGKYKKIGYTETEGSSVNRLHFVVFDYSSDKLEYIRYYLNESYYIKNIELYQGSNIMLWDRINDVELIAEMNGNKVGQIIKTSGEIEEVCMSIEYEDKKTVVTDELLQKTNTIFFDSNGLPLYEIDNDYYVVKNKFNDSNNIIFTSEPINVKNKQYNLLPSSSISGFTRTGVTVTSSSIAASSFYYPIIGGTVYRVSGTGTLTRTINVSGLALDKLTLVLFGKQLTTYSQSSKVKVKLALDDKEESSDEFKKTTLDDNYDLMVLGVNANESYSQIKITIELTNATIMLGGIQVLQRDAGTYYEYDENLNIISECNGSGTVSNTYNDDNLVESNINYDLTTQNYEYGKDSSTGAINSVTKRTNYGVVGIKEYNSDNLETRSIIKNDSGTKILEVTNEYNDTRTIKTTKDELENTTVYEQYSFGKIKKVTDALNQVTSYNYDSYTNLTEVIFGNNIRVKYTYKDQRIETATLPNGSVYTFSYENNEIKTISLNGTVIFRYNYDSLGRIEYQRNGSSGDGYKFEYQDGRITKVYYVSTTSSETLKYQYVYENGKLNKVKDASGNVIKEYIYDVNGNIVKVNENQVSIDYQYDNLGNLGNTMNTVLSKKIDQSYDVPTLDKRTSDNYTHSITNLHTINQTVLNNYEIYPLHNSLVSLNGLKPVAFSLNNDAGAKSNVYKYNSLAKKNCFVADGKELKYQFGNSSVGTIALRVMFELSGVKEYLFECKDNDGNKISLYRDTNNKLICYFNNTIISTGLYCVNNKWYTIALSYSQASATSSVPIIVYKNDGDGSQNYSCSVTLSSMYKTLTTSIGRKTDKENQTCYPLTGQIEMIAVKSSSCNVSALNSLAQELNEHSKTTTYDELGLVQEINAHKSGDSILKNTYEYKTRSDTRYKSSQVNKEVIKYGSSTDTRTYTTDVEGRVRSVTDNTFGSHTYEYDYRGFLTKEDNTNYTYDNNGNILTAGSDTFTYDSTIKDRLVKVNNTSISYSINNPGNPKYYGNKEFEFEGRRLICVTEDITSDEYKTTEYTYNDQGLIVRRSMNHWFYDDRDPWGETTNYYYDGDKLITEVTPSHRNDYLYDENGQIYGFIQDSTTKYFYMKDFMQNILGIVDINGNLVVKYNYDTYGNLISYSGSNIYNPIRYKGYYFDEEVDMFYCKTRFYVPKWRRWLNNDSSQYLDVENIGCVNLYAYCNNNPVMGMDPTGHSVILLGALLIGASFAVGFGASALSQGIKYGFENINYWQCTTDGLFAGASTALSFTGIGMLASIGLGAAMGFGQYAADSAFHNEDISFMGSVSSIILGGIGGAISGAGARNLRNIANEMKLTGSGATAVSAITNAANRRAADLISEKGMQGVLNLYGRTAFEAVQAAMAPTIRKIMIKSSIKIMIWATISTGTSLGLSYL